MRVLTVTTLYPNAEFPTFCVFVENRLRRLAACDGVTARVVAPVPSFPSRARRFGRYAAYARVPRAERRHGIEVTHPRYLVLPKVGMASQPLFLYASLARHIRREIVPEFDFDVIDAHYFYPDGVAATLLAKRLGKPVVITGRGTDLNLYPRRYALPRRMIAWAAREADASITVCAALKDVLVELGAAPDRVRVLRNGVDLQLFRPLDRAAARARWGGVSSGPTLASVGHLIERKGHHVAIEAMPLLPREVGLLVVGDGPECGRLEGLARSLGVAERVRFTGAVAHERLAEIYAAADALVLASSREGWPNVLLEAMACGTPVIASRNWGTPEIVTAPEAGRLLDETTPAAVAAAVTALLRNPPDRAATRRFAERFSWDETTQGQLDLFRSILAARRAAGGTPS